MKEKELRDLRKLRGVWVLSQEKTLQQLEENVKGACKLMIAEENFLEIDMAINTKEV